MGYDGPKRDSRGLGLEIREWNVAQKNLKNNTGFLIFFTHNAC